MKFGIRWRAMMREREAPISSAALTKSSSRSDEELGAHRARKARPVEQAEDDRDAEEDEDRAPVRRQRRRKREPERQLGQRAQDLDQALHGSVDEAAEIAGEPAERQPEDEGDDDADEADGQRDARAVDDAREQVAAELVGAEQEQRAVLGRADEMEIGRGRARRAVGLAAAEEADRLRLPSCRSCSRA